MLRKVFLRSYYTAFVCNRLDQAELNAHNAVLALSLGGIVAVHIGRVRPFDIFGGISALQKRQRRVKLGKAVESVKLFYGGAQSLAVCVVRKGDGVADLYKPALFIVKAKLYRLLSVFDFFNIK